MSNVDLSWMNVPGPDGVTFAQRYAQPQPQPDLSWMNQPGPDGVSFAQRYAQPQVDLSWMNQRGANGFTFIESYQRGTLPAQTGGTKDQRDAFALIQEQLNGFGLGGMADKVWQYILQNGTDDVNRMQLWIYEQPEFKARFPAFEALQKKYRGIQPAEYVQLERQYAQVMRAAGITANYFDDPNDFKALIENDVSQAEFQERVENGFRRVSQADPAVRSAFQRYFGVEGDAALAAFFIDPEKAAPKLAKAAQMAELGGTASTMGVEINSAYAEKLARLGVSQQQALAGFQKMQQQRSLFAKDINEVSVQGTATTGSDTAADLGLQPGISANDMDAATQVGIDYAFGTDTNVQRELQLRLEKRRAQASGVSQQVTANREGRTSLGTTTD